MVEGGADLDLFSRGGGDRTPAQNLGAAGPGGKQGGVAQHHDAGLDDLTDGIIDYKVSPSSPLPRRRAMEGRRT